MADHPDEWSEDYWRPTMHFSREHVAEALTAERLRSGSIKGLTEDELYRRLCSTTNSSRSKVRQSLQQGVRVGLFTKRADGRYCLGRRQKPKRLKKLLSFELAGELSGDVLRHACLWCGARELGACLATGRRLAEAARAPATWRAAALRRFPMLGVLADAGGGGGDWKWLYRRQLFLFHGGTHVPAPRPPPKLDAYRVGFEVWLRDPRVNRDAEFLCAGVARPRSDPVPPVPSTQLILGAPPFAVVRYESPPLPVPAAQPWAEALDASNGNRRDLFVRSAVSPLADLSRAAVLYEGLLDEYDSDNDAPEPDKLVFEAFSLPIKELRDVFDDHQRHLVYSDERQYEPCAACTLVLDDDRMRPPHLVFSFSWEDAHGWDTGDGRRLVTDTNLERLLHEFVDFS